MATVHHRSWQETYGHLVPDGYFDEFTLAQDEQNLRAALASPPGPGRRRLIAVDAVSGAVVGLAFAGEGRARTPKPQASADQQVPAARDHELFMLYVAGDWHGTGVSSALLDAVLPAGPAQLWVAEDNPRAQAFYRKHGFTPDGARDVWCGPGIAELRMLRD